MTIKPSLVAATRQSAAFLKTGIGGALPRRRYAPFLALALLSTLNPQLSTLFAQVPSVISYQGRVQASGTNFSGTGQFKFALVSAGTNVSRRATATATVTSGFVTGITVTDGGVGYTSPPAVTITDSTGSGATATAQVSGGAVTNITVQSAGVGYSASPTVTIAQPPPSFVYGTFWSNDGTSSAGGEPSSAVPVSVQQGLFTVFLGDTNLPNMQALPENVFTQPDVRLRIWFSNGASGFAQLSPDQRLGSVGYAIMAAHVSDAAINVAALADNSVTTGKLATNSVTTERIEDGTISASDLAPVLLDGTFWKLTGNSATTPTHFVGTSDNRPLDLRVNNQRALRLEPTASNNTVNVVGGSARNFVASGVVGATISGGGSGDYGGIAYTNLVRADFGTIGGGGANTISTNAINSTIAGGYLNDIGASSEGSTIGGGIDNNIAGAVGFFFHSAYSTIGGGRANNIASESAYSVIAGGRDNNIDSALGAGESYSAIGGGNNNNIGASSTSSTIAGGEQNNIGVNSDDSVIGGGGDNRVGTNSQYATIPGGNNNFATTRAFAAGTRAKANAIGAFVWADSNNADVTAISANSVTMRASGGYWLFSNSGTTAGAFLAPNGTSWAAISDRNAKKDFAPVDTRSILEKLAALPITQWHYRWEEQGATPHVGPMAQDFKAAFYPGRDDKSITTQEADGVALAAIQGLNRKVEGELKAKDARIDALEKELATLKELVAKLSTTRN